jgi:hypothetical protein
MVLVDLASDPFFKKLITRFLYRVFKDYGSVRALANDNRLDWLDKVLDDRDMFDRKMCFDDIYDVIAEFFSRRVMTDLGDVLDDHDQDDFHDDQRDFFWEIQALVYERLQKERDFLEAQSVKKTQSVKTYVEFDLFGNPTAETVILDVGLKRTTVKVKPGAIAGSQLGLF